jgi:membrane-associated protein
VFVDVPASLGYPALFALIAGESAGLLLPGETALIVAAALASDGQLDLTAVLAVATAAAITGDNIGYLLGRKGLERLLTRPGRTASARRRAVQHAEAFFGRYGSFAVFAGRWMPGLRIVAAWIAGAARMPWQRFLLWNALGAVAWATTIGVASYTIGRQVSGAVITTGLAFTGIIAFVFALRLIARRRSNRRTGGTHAYLRPQGVFTSAQTRGDPDGVKEHVSEGSRA